MEVGGQLHAPAALPPGKRPATDCTGDWVGPESFFAVVENLAPTRIWPPDRPDRSELHHRPSRPGPARPTLQNPAPRTWFTGISQTTIKQYSVIWKQAKSVNSGDTNSGDSQHTQEKLGRRSVIIRLFQTTVSSGISFHIQVHGIPSIRWQTHWLW